MSLKSDLMTVFIVKVCCFLRKLQLTLPITEVVVVTGLVW